MSVASRFWTASSLETDLEGPASRRTRSAPDVADRSVSRTSSSATLASRASRSVCRCSSSSRASASRRSCSAVSASRRASTVAATCVISSRSASAASRSSNRAIRSRPIWSSVSRCSRSVCVLPIVLRASRARRASRIPPRARLPRRELRAAPCEPRAPLGDLCGLALSSVVASTRAAPASLSWCSSARSPFALRPRAAARPRIAFGAGACDLGLAPFDLGEPSRYRRRPGPTCGRAPACAWASPPAPALTTAAALRVSSATASSRAASAPS